MTESRIWVGNMRTPLVAHPDQLAGTRLSRVVGGSGDGALLLTVWSPSRVELELQVDRALDITSLRFNGVPVGWSGPPGLSPRTVFEPTGFGWQRTFHGGLLTTCGLEHVGDPVVAPNDQGPPTPRTEQYGEHGRISHLPAEIIERRIDDENDLIRVVGIIRQASIYSERLELERTIEVGLTAPWIRVKDVVRNAGSLPARHDLLYHLNFGYPLSQPGSTVSTGQFLYELPELEAASTELVELLEVASSREVTIASPEGIRVRLHIGPELPRTLLWALPRSHSNVIGIAPTTSGLDGKPHTLDAGSSRTYEIRIDLDLDPPLEGPPVVASV